MDKNPFKVFVVEDNEWYNKLLVYNLSLNPDYEVISFLNGQDCLAALGQNPDVVTLDYRLPDMTGIDVLKKIKQFNEDIQVVLISEQSDIEVVVDLLKLGVYDYIVKSNDIKERLLNTINNIRQRALLKNEINDLRNEVRHKYSFQNSIIGNSKAVKDIYTLIEKAVRTNISVMVSGETGTGKELVAKAIHYNSKRKDKPFVAVNVAAIPSELFESELFGHEKGAFTGASFRRTGKFEEANGGTLFLDEIAEMDTAFQAKLLRALQEKEITRIGSNKSVKVDCRIIVATNKNLLEEVKSGNFREDLYYRIFGLTVDLPPLRERDTDVLILSKHFINEFCNENQIENKGLSQQAINKLLSYSFPGNIRELKAVIELAVTLSDGSTIDENSIVLGTNDILSNSLNNEKSLREYERQILDIYMKKYNSNTKLIAEKLEISVATIYRMLKE